MLHRRIILLLLSVLLLSATLLNAEPVSTVKASWPAYVFSAFIGFGVGQYYIGENGTPFLIGDLAGIAAMGGGYLYFMISLSNPANYYGMSSIYSTALVGYGIVALGGFTFLASRIWEMVDTVIDVDRLSKEGLIAIRPTIGVSPDQVSFQIKFQY
jgi:hypothetical protein